MRNIFLLIILLPCCLFAADEIKNGVEPIKMEISPTYENIGIKYRFHGDANNNVSGKVTYRKKGDAKWLEAHYPVKIQINYGRGNTKPYETMATSVMFLNENTEYEVNFEIIDPDGVTKQLPSQTVKTLNSKVNTGTGKIYYINNDAAEHGDGSKEKPFNNFKAIKSLQPGDVLELVKGTHHLSYLDQITLEGTEDAYITIRGSDGVILTDADPKISGVGKLPYELHKKDVDGRQIYKADVQNTIMMAVRKKTGNPSTSYIFWGFTTKQSIFWGKDKRAGPHRGATLEHLEQNTTNMNEYGAFIQDGDTLYFTVPDGIDIKLADLQISRRYKDKNGSSFVPGGLRVVGKYVVIENITMENRVSINCRDFSKTKPSSNIIVRNMQMYGKVADYYGGFAIAKDSLVENCLAQHNSYWDWYSSKPARVEGKGNNRPYPWFKIKDNPMNDSSVFKYMSDVTIRDCTFINQSNALPTFTAKDIPEKGNIDVYRNYFLRTGDDCIEPDGAGINMRVYDNKMEEFHNGFSDAPVHTGPAFIVRNQFIKFHQAAIKIRNGARGWTFYYHNVCVPETDTSTAADGKGNGKFAFCPDSEGVKNMVMRNNIFHANVNAYTLQNARMKIEKHVTLDLDYNLYFPYMNKWKIMFEEENGVQEKPVYVDEEKGDYRIGKEATQQIDKGEIIIGINDQVPATYQFKGAKPDIGLLEFGVEAPYYGRKASE